jgi:NAD(P)-dependent dehydrogenase (short-subunit alcohol dehydrogenase family)
VSLKNARVVVIGGTSGIGLGVASAAAERGAIPIVVSRQQSSVDHALSQLAERARGATVDLTDLTGLERLAADIGDIEHLVFTAGESLELAPIRVNAVAPGVVRTPLWDAMGEADRQAMYDQAAQQIPLGRVGEVGDTARAYLYCMEQEFGTGVVLTVDGGTTLV